MVDRSKRRALIASLLFTSASMMAMQAGVASADELSELKAQLEALQARVDDLSARPQQPQQPQLPDGVSLLTVSRGSMSNEGFDRFTSPRDRLPSDRGITIAVTPTADLPAAPPAPVHEITIGGYVKGDAILDFDGGNGDLFLFTTLEPGPDDEHVRLHARQSRFNIKSRSETPIGEIRTHIEGDFFGEGLVRPSGSRTGGADFRLRHAFGEWDMTPNWTFGAGQTWSNFMPLWDLADTLDFNGPILVFNRQGQVRLTYHSGPIEASVSVEDPVTSFATDSASHPVPDPVRPLNLRGNERVPTFTGRFEYTLPGEHKLLVSGVAGENRIESSRGDDEELFWGVVGAAQFHLFDRLVSTTSGGYGDGHGRFFIGADVANNVFFDADGSPNIEGREFWYIMSHVNVALTDTISVNGVYSRIDFESDDTLVGQTDWLQTVHGNVMWQPVQQLKMGLEVQYAERDIDGITETDATRIQFGTFFFF